MCLTYSLNQRWLARFCRECDRCRSTSYEDLSANPAAETERICAFLGVPFTEDMLDLPWRRNTSFEGRQERSRSLNSLDRALVAVAVAGLRLVPLPLLRSFHDRRKARHGIEWPDWCWRRRDAGLGASSPEVSDLAR
jgi:hypothetical protein